MIHILWEFEVIPDRAEEFLQHYSNDGTWMQIFRKSPAFIETRLMQDSESAARFVTIDTWEDRSGFEDFKRVYRSEYEALDRRCEPLTKSERLIGMFEAAK